MVFTLLWWTATVPEEGPFATSAALLHTHRERILGLDPILIVPGHGPTRSTPR